MARKTFTVEIAKCEGIKAVAQQIFGRAAADREIFADKGGYVMLSGVGKVLVKKVIETAKSNSILLFGKEDYEEHELRGIEYLKGFLA